MNREREEADGQVGPFFATRPGRLIQPWWQVIWSSELALTTSRQEIGFSTTAAKWLVDELTVYVEMQSHAVFNNMLVIF